MTTCKLGRNCCLQDILGTCSSIYCADMVSLENTNGNWSKRLEEVNEAPFKVQQDYYCITGSQDLSMSRKVILKEFDFTCQQQSDLERKIKPENLIKEIDRWVKNESPIENDKVILLSRALVEYSSPLSVLDIFKPILSPKNCLGVTILAQACGDTALKKCADTYVSRNLDFVISNESMKRLNWGDFRCYLLCCSLDVSEKRKLLAAWHSNQFDISEFNTPKNRNMPIDTRNRVEYEYNMVDMQETEFGKVQLLGTKPRANLRSADTIDLPLTQKEDFASIKMPRSSQFLIALQDAQTGKMKTTSANSVSELQEFKMAQRDETSSAPDEASNGNKENNTEIKRDLIRRIELFLASIETVENDDVINLLEEILKDGSQPDLGYIFKPMLSPNNCLGISILASHCCDDDLAKYVNDYISRNLDIITRGTPLKNFRMKYFWKYLLSCNLNDANKDQLIKAKLSHMLPMYDVEPTMRNCLTQEDLEITKLTLRLSVNYPQFDKLTTWCYRTLKNELSDSNCLDMVILAKDCGLDELKIWADYHILSNFQAVILNILRNAYRHEVIIKYLKESALPAALQEMINISYYNQSVLLTILTAENGQHSKSTSSFDLSHFWKLNLQAKQETRKRNKTKWLLSALKKVPSKKTQTIGMDGGIIELDGCSVSFPAGVLTTDVTITMLIDTNPENYPDTGMAISPILSIKPSMSFAKPVYVKMQTCFGAEPGKTLLVSLFHKEHGSSWKLDRKVNVGSENFISFSTLHFSGKCISTGIEDIDEGLFSLRNDVFITVGTGLIVSCFSHFETDSRVTKKVMWENNCSSFAKRPVKIKGSKEDLIKLHIDMSRPVLTIDQESWVPGEQITMKEAHDEDGYYVDADPGHDITSLQGGFVSGIYKVFVGPLHRRPATAILKSEWPVRLDPEVSDPPICRHDHVHHTTAGILADHSTIHQKKENVLEMMTG